MSGAGVCRYIPPETMPSTTSALAPNSWGGFLRAILPPSVGLGGKASQGIRTVPVPGIRIPPISPPRGGGGVSGTRNSPRRTCRSGRNPPAQTPLLRNSSVIIGPKDRDFRLLTSCSPSNVEPIPSPSDRDRREFDSAPSDATPSRQGLFRRRQRLTAARRQRGTGDRRVRNRR